MSAIDRSDHVRNISFPPMPKTGRTHKLSIVTTSATLLELGRDVNYITLIAETDCFLKVGGSNIVATAPVVGTPGDMIIKAGAAEIYVNGQTYISVLAKVADGDIYIAEMEEV
jgi:hypothetical protein